MNVYTFYEPIANSFYNNEYKDLIDLWKKSWIKQGWNPIIFNLNDSKKHPLYNEIYSICEKRPTLNEKNFEMYCYLRWLAMANVTGWYCDVDIINYGFKPIDYGDLVVSSDYVKKIHGTCFYMPKEKYQQLILEIKNYQVSFDDVHIVNGKAFPHLSDLMIMSKTKIKIDQCISIHGSYKASPNWKTDLLVHYTTPCTLIDPEDKNKTRVNIIKEDPRSKIFLNS
jgi:hypothetical protein